ncbi:GH32 C-terminal domain-containing protein, partial [Singulisphaera rosea]
ATLHVGRPETWTDRELRAGQTLPLMPSGRQFHVSAEVDIPAGAKLTLNVRGIPVTLTSTTLSSDRRSATVRDRVKSFEMLIDTTSIETFVNRGELSFTKFVLPYENGLSIRAEGGPILIRSLTVHPLRSAWPDSPPS